MASAHDTVSDGRLLLFWRLLDQNQTVVNPTLSDSHCHLQLQLAPDGSDWIQSLQGVLAKLVTIVAESFLPKWRLRTIRSVMGDFYYSGDF